MAGKKEIVIAEKAPRAIGPYSAAVKAGNLVFTAGQLGIDPESGEFVPGGIEAETRQALLNLTAVLEAAGSSLGSVVKTTVFLRDMNDEIDQRVESNTMTKLAASRLKKNYDSYGGKFNNLLQKILKRLD